MAESFQKILFITSRSDQGGGPKALSDLIRNLPSEKVFIAAPDNDHYSKSFKNNSAKFISIPHRKFSFFKLFTLLNFCKINGISTIHSHGRGAGIYSRLLGLFGFRVIHTFHGVHRPKSTKDKITIYIEKALSMLTSTFICVSKSESLNAIELGVAKGDSLVIIPNGYTFSDSKFKTDFLIPPLRIGILTRLDPHKNVSRGLELFKELSKKYPDTKLEIAGDGEERELLQRKVNELGISPIVSFLGETSEPLRFIENQDLMIFSSKGEGLPYTVLECFEVGRPVLASKVSGHVDLLSENELFDLNSSDDFLKKFDLVSSGNISKNRKKLLGEFSLDNCITQIIKFYDS